MFDNNIDHLSFSSLAYDFVCLLNKLVGENPANKNQIFLKLKSIQYGSGLASGDFVVRKTEDEGLFFDFELEEREIR